MKKGLKIALVSIIALPVILVLAAQIILNSAIVTRYVDKFAGECIDGSLGYSRIRVSLIRGFPDIRVDVGDLAVTYPHDRFSAFEGRLPRDPLLGEGRGVESDTLLSCRSVSLSVNPWRLFRKRIEVTGAGIGGLRAYARRYDGNTANWDIFISSGEPSDTSSAELSLPLVCVDSIVISDCRLSLYDVPDSLSAVFDLYRLSVSVDGLGIGTDSISVSGAVAALDSRLQAAMAGSISTDLRMELDMSVDGLYSPVSMPVASVCLRIPESRTFYAPLDVAMSMLLDVDADLDAARNLTAEIHEFNASVPGLDLTLGGKAEDLLSNDPCYMVSAGARADIGRLFALLPGAAGTGYADGDLRMDLYAHAHQSEIESYRFTDSEVRGSVLSDRIELNMPEDSLHARSYRTELRLDSSPEGFVLNLDSDSLYVNMGVGLIARVRNIRNEARISKVESSGSMVPQMRLSSDSDRLFVKAGSSRFGIRGASIAASAQKRVRREMGARRRMLDSLQLVYPDVPRGELALRFRQEREGSRPVPAFLQEKDFEKGDIRISLDSTLMKYYRAWSPSGHVMAQEGFYASPVLPIRTRLTALHADFDDDSIVIDTIGVVSGTSDLNVSGFATGLRRAIMGRGVIDADLKIRSERLNINEIVAALELGHKDIGEVAPEDEFDESFVTDTLADAQISPEGLPLIIVPANLRAAVDLKAGRVDYSDIGIGPLSTGLRMQERTLQLTGTDISTELGDIYLDAFYSTKTKEDISAGVNLRLTGMSAHGIISMLPAVDTFIPALRSLYGDLGCEISATAQLDTNMNILIPSLDGLIRISGDNLEVKDAGDLRKITRLLLFKDKNIGKIDNMHVDALIHDSKMEIFPFEIGVDRYRFALWGTQSFDETMYYHLSVLKSPLLLRFGINIYGTLDNWRFSLGRAKYRDGSIPAYESRLDTVHLNLAESIRNIYDRGVDNVMRHNRSTMGTFHVEEDGGDDMLTTEELVSIEDMSLQQELAEQEDQLIADVDAVLADAYLDVAKMMSQYESTIYDKKIMRKIERLKRQEARKAAKGTK